MDIEQLRRQAKEDAQNFLENDKQYRMGYIEAELPHKLTKRLSQTYASSIEEGVALILSVDAQMAQRAEQTLESAQYAQFADTIRNTLSAGHKVVFSGCGSSGRLSMGLERMWRSGIAKLSAQYPQAKKALEEKLENVGNIMTGGDYAVIRAVESFEDSPELGKEQTRQWNLGEGDLLVGVTATGETTSILGTAVQALSTGADVYMLICADHKPLVEKMDRARQVYLHPKCRVLNLPCGAMALTGSTRMQSSTFEQLAGAVALESALLDVVRGCGVQLEIPEYGTYGKYFRNAIAQLQSPQAVRKIAQASHLEKATYEAGAVMTLYAGEYLLDVLTDTTERAPTFMTPPFCSSDMSDQPQSWAFVKNPTCDTLTAWEKCFLRQPRCVEWDKDTYARLGFTPRQIEKISPIGIDALRKFCIGNEQMPEREEHLESHAMWVDVDEAPEDFFAQAQRYGSYSQLTLSMLEVIPAQTVMDIMEHLCIKVMLNTLSTGVMASMGKVAGNWMICLALSNKKLVDRGARIVSDVCGVSYEQALEENYFSKALVEAENRIQSPVQETILRLGLA